MEDKASTHPPTVSDLRDNPVVKSAIEAAWNDSNPHDFESRHEKGGWIYMSLVNGELTVRRARAGHQSEINLAKPPHVAGHVLIGLFHIHPNPSADGWEPGPSEADRYADERDGVPDLIRADNGIHLSGPESRRGGLAGGPGFPP